jgi:hypothetical protein
MKCTKLTQWVLVLSVMCLPVSAMAVSGIGRADSWEFHLPLIYAADAEFSGNRGSSVEFNDDVGISLGGAYNVTDRLQLGALIDWNSRSYDATVVRGDGSVSRYNSYMESSTISLNGTFFLLKGNISPFLTGSIGYTFVDTNIENGPPEDVCWWDPWWGYVCNEYVPTRTESDLSYGAGVGLRVDMNEFFSLECSYNKSWIDIDNASETPDFDMWRLDLIFRR